MPKPTELTYAQQEVARHPGMKPGELPFTLVMERVRAGEFSQNLADKTHSITLRPKPRNPKARVTLSK